MELIRFNGKAGDDLRKDRLTQEEVERLEENGYRYFPASRVRIGRRLVTVPPKWLK